MANGVWRSSGALEVGLVSLRETEHNFSRATGLESTESSTPRRSGVEASEGDKEGDVAKLAAPLLNRNWSRKSSLGMYGVTGLGVQQPVD